MLKQKSTIAYFVPFFSWIVNVQVQVIRANISPPEKKLNAPFLLYRLPRSKGRARQAVPHWYPTRVCVCYFLQYI